MSALASLPSPGRRTLATESILGHRSGWAIIAGVSSIVIAATWLLASLGVHTTVQRHANERIAIAAARLEQACGDRRIFGQPCGEHAPGGPGADNDIVEGVVGLRCR